MNFTLQTIVNLLLRYRYEFLLPIAIIEGPIISVIAGLLVSIGKMNFWIRKKNRVGGKQIQRSRRKNPTFRQMVTCFWLCDFGLFWHGQAKIRQISFGQLCRYDPKILIFSFDWFLFRSCVSTDRQVSKLCGVYNCCCCRNCGNRLCCHHKICE